MGKDSLIKSTSKDSDSEKKGAKKKAAAKSTKKTAAAKTTKAKKPAAKTTKKATAKAPVKAKAAKKASPKKAKKAAAKPAKKATAAKSTAKKKTAAWKVKKPTVRELLHLKFEPMQPLATTYPQPAPAQPPAASPPLIASKDPEEVARIRSVLNQKFSMAEIKAAAKAPATVAAPAPTAKPDAAAAAQTTPPAAAEEEKPAAPKARESAYITTQPPQDHAPADPVARAAKIAIGLAAVVVLLLLSISYNNSAKYYILPQENAIEIRKGRFSPKDDKFFMVLHGTEFTEPAKEVYTKKEVFPLVFTYFLEKADTLLEVPGLPDFDGIKDYLHQAEDYSVTAEMKSTVNTRLNTIERMILLYKADVAMSKGTLDSLKSAIKLLKQAAKLSPSTLQADEINAKITAAGEAITAIKTKARQEAEKK